MKYILTVLYKMHFLLYFKTKETFMHMAWYCLAVEIVLIIYINLQDILSSSFNILLDIIVPIMHN